MSDASLVARALKDPDAFSVIVEHYEASLLRFILSLTRIPRADAEDLLQKVFIKAYAHLHDFDPSLRLSTWLFRIARNAVISDWRHRTSRPQESELLDDAFSLPASQAEKLDSHLTRAAVADTLALLPVHYREVLILFFFEEKSYAEIADILRTTTGTVSSLISRAKKEFARLAAKTKLIHHLP